MILRKNCIIRSHVISKLLFPVLFFLLPTSAASQPPFFRTYNYIDKYAKVAVEEMVEFKIPASVILAQAVLESRSGTSDLASRSNNHFGIKCHSTWTGDTIIKDDDAINECFRRYETVEQSYKDHSLFLTSRSRYAKLFSLPMNDYKSWCLGLKAAGYATSATYAEELIKVIEETRLFLFDGPEILSDKKIIPLSRSAEIQVPSFSGSLQLKDFTDGDLLFANEADLQIHSILLYLAQAQHRKADIAVK